MQFAILKSQDNHGRLQKIQFMVSQEPLDAVRRAQPEPVCTFRFK